MRSSCKLNVTMVSLETCSISFRSLFQMQSSCPQLRIDTGMVRFVCSQSKQIKSQKPQSKKEAAAPLISSHRSIMSEMLGMVKQEMTLVNCTDEDRALIDEYLDELEEIQDKQLSMISSLRQSLVEYYGNRPSVEEADDSFEALLSS